RVSAIVADLKIAVGSHPLIKPVLDEEEPTARESIGKVELSAPVVAAPYSASAWVEQSGDGTSLVVPIRVPLPMFRKDIPPAPLVRAPYPLGGNGGAQNGGAPPMIVPPTGLLPRISATNGLPMEAVHIDQTTLKSRPGYKANFLGTGKFSV